MMNHDPEIDIDESHGQSETPNALYRYAQNTRVGIAAFLKAVVKASFWEHTVPAAYAVIFWWGATAAIIFLNFQSELRPMLFWTSFSLAAASFWLLWRQRNDETVRGAYIGFTGGTLIWAFVECSFYTGYIVGPRVRPIFRIGPSWASFLGAIHQSLYHELLVLGLAAAISFVAYRSKNKFGLYTFLVLWLMHQSTKINVFLGVVNINKQFVPDTVEQITQYMTIASMNWAFPFSITICTIVAYRILSRVHTATSRFVKVGFVLVGVMSILGLLEHWLLVLPLDKTLWDIAIHRIR
jgi:putative photosynthetic complex assembly protein 2